LAGFKILFFIILLTPKCFGKFTCISNEGKATLHYISAEKKDYELVDFQFDNFGFVPSIMNCSSFVEQIKYNFSIQENLSDKNLHQVLTFNESFAARMQGPTREECYKLCQKSLGCKLKFPFNIFTIGERQDFNKLFKQHYSQCLERNRLAFQSMVPSSFESILTPIEVFDNADRKITDEFFKLYDSAKWDKIYLSSMTMSADFLKKLFLRAGNSKTEIHILFSFTLQSLLKEFPDYFFQYPANIKIHPIFIDPGSDSAYHVKGALFLGRDPKFLFFTANFRNYDDEVLSDLAMIAYVKKTQDLENHFLNQIKTNCQSKKYFNCTLLIRFETNSPAQDLFNRIAISSCANQNETKSNPIAFNARNTNIKTFIHDQIKMAKTSVDIQTHQFNDPDLVTILDKLRGKGIQIRLIVGLNKSKRLINRPYIQYNDSDINYHSKFIIVDKTKLLWMTGNLTKNSYLNPWETFFIVNEKNLLEAFSNKMNSTYLLLKR
jgi:hypothetical protein